MTSHGLNVSTERLETLFWTSRLGLVALTSRSSLATITPTSRSHLGLVTPMSRSRLGLDTLTSWSRLGLGIIVSFTTLGCLHKSAHSTGVSLDEASACWTFIPFELPTHPTAMAYGVSSLLPTSVQIWCSLIGVERPRTRDGTSQKLGRNDHVWGGRGSDRPGADQLWGGSTVSRSDCSGRRSSPQDSSSNWTNGRHWTTTAVVTVFIRTCFILCLIVIQLLGCSDTIMQ